MKQAVKLATELLAALLSGNVKLSCELTDKLKQLMDTFKVSC